MSKLTPPPFEVAADETFRSRLLMNLHDLQQTNSFTDFTIRLSQTDSIPCHKVVLSAACPYFHAMLRCGLQEVEKQVVDLGHMDHEVVKQLVEYFYTGRVKIQCGKMKLLVEACELFQIAELKKKSCDYIAQQLTPHNCIDWCHFATTYNMKNVIINAREIMIKFFQPLIDNPELLELSLAEIIDLIKSDNLNVPNEDAVLLGCLKWLNHDRKQRLADVSQLLNHLRLEFCTQSCLWYASKEFAEIMATHDIQKSLAMCMSGNPDAVPQRRKAYDSKKPKITLVGGLLSNGVHGKGVTLQESKWTTFTNLPHYWLKKSSICCISDGLLLTGGILKEKVYDWTYLFYQNASSWIRFSNMQVERHSHASHARGKFVYVFGGRSNTEGNLCSVSRLSLETNHWGTVSEMKHSIYRPITAQLDIFIYVVMNTNPGNKQEYERHGLTMQEFNTVTETWRLRQPMPSDVITTRGASAVAANDKLYVVGGDAKLCSQYDPKTDNWTKLTGSILRHIYGCALAFEGKLLLMGGAVDDDLLELTDEVEEYDMEENRWIKATFKLPCRMQEMFVTSLYV